MTLREYLSDKSITVRDFAERLGVSPVTVSRWLNGQRRPEWSLLAKIEAETGGAVTAKDFVAGPAGAEAR